MVLPLTVGALPLRNSPPPPLALFSLTVLPVSVPSPLLKYSPPPDPEAVLLNSWLLLIVAVAVMT